MRWPTSCRPSGAARPSTRRLRPWGRRGGGTPEPPRPLAGSPWTSSRVGGRSRAGRLRNRAASGPFVSPWRSRNSCASAQNVKCITSNYGNCISPADGLAVRKNYANEVGLEVRGGGLGGHACRGEKASPAAFYLFIHFLRRRRFSSTVYTRYLPGLYFNPSYMKESKQSAHPQPSARRWRTPSRSRCEPRTDTSPSPTGRSWIWSVCRRPLGSAPGVRAAHQRPITSYTGYTVSAQHCPPPTLFLTL